MVFKRPFSKEGEEGFGASKRRTVRDVIGRISEDEIMHAIEPLLRRVDYVEIQDSTSASP